MRAAALLIAALLLALTGCSGSENPAGGAPGGEPRGGPQRE